MAKIFQFNLKKMGGAKGMSKMTLSTQTPEHLERRAEEILERYEIKKIPVDPLYIAMKEGAEVFNANFSNPDVSGVIRKKDNVVQIYVNQSNVPVRKRFTIAHELGHLFLHLDGKDGNFIDNNFLFRNTNSGDSNQKEIEANRFAAALLMPRGAILKEWEDQEFIFDLDLTISELAQKFNVSEQAMKHRLSNLGYICSTAYRKQDLEVIQ